MHDVFISYSSKNKNIADNICHHLESKHIKCWYAPRDAQVGGNWAGDIMNAIDTAKVFILVYTKESNHSDHVLKEVTAAANAKCKIVKFAITAEETNPDLTYHLSIAHWLDATTIPLEKHIRQLVVDVEKLLKQMKEKEDTSPVQVVTSEDNLKSKGSKQNSTNNKNSANKQTSTKKTSGKTKPSNTKNPSMAKIKEYFPIGIVLLVVVAVIIAGIIFGNGRSGTLGDASSNNTSNPTDVFGNQVYKREEITSVVFVDNLEGMPKNAWVALRESEKEVMAWIEETDEGYRLFLASDGKVSFDSCEMLFNKYVSLKEIDFNNAFDTSNVSDMSAMFQNCTALTKLDLSTLDTSRATDLSFMFNHCGALEELNISNFDTGRVNNFRAMFQGCEMLETIDVSGFDTSYGLDMSNMFRSCISLKELDVSNFNTSYVVNMAYMFYDCNMLKELDVSGFDTSCVTDMTGMFRECKVVSKLDVSGFNTAAVMNMNCMFYDCVLLQSLDVSNFNTSRVTDMSFMFSNCTSLMELDLSNFDTGCVTDMSYMFQSCKNLTKLDVSGFDMSNVKNEEGIFSNAGVTAEEAKLPN